MASSTASLTKFSDAISSRPSCWRRTSLSIASAIWGSTSASGRVMELGLITFNFIHRRPAPFHLGGPMLHKQSQERISIRSQQGDNRDPLHFIAFLFFDRSRLL